ncbi:MSHA pilin protein MshD [Candidatus Kryptonium thompsonii]|uniref:MSHA pilin protein MshD n=1 Tax=Candidatus Kryptonium thompsonii TaxID=1633631 RepID=A0A0P1NZF0_9BACT|nr:hypothetical protein [Candidatus Kryptonium thompsoni]CUS77750.1 MSHA pilin protein MshD [Candidatus Kryptonium thompsoni]CUS79370.1 MSHA pilin protein MshD [Candidatus Kryptonium thompsoni]CUS81573.1 MSHA pilin protein MshD [Candidatus Kryptonium thompsoni]CUS83645.1 MSHA pilin protein MshD [Candidatus Kryptonium thompsoni]CUS86732.1 MSHA pilin protein MshD [Candidatus Kryptonium thompsoni]
MTTGQTLITILALALLSLAVLNVNRGLSSHDVSLAQNRYRLEALSIATSYIEQASQYYFDEAVADTNNTAKTDPNTFSSTLGLDPDDTTMVGAMEIDDFDDYNSISKIDTGRSSVIYKVSFKVEYVDLSGNRVIPVSYKTFHKRMTVFISDIYDPPLIYKETASGKVRDTIKISFVYSYWFYN